MINDFYSIKYISNAFLDLPKWDEVILDLELNKLENSEVLILDRGGFVTFKGYRIPSVHKIQEKIHELRPEKSNINSHLYISFLSVSQTFGWHNDNTDVFYIQAIGKTKWQVRNSQLEIEEYELSPGDLIYVPKSFFHNSIPLTPRVGISIGFN